MSENESQPRWIRRQGAYSTRSIIWKHWCQKSDDTTLIKCDYCPKTMVYSGSTTNPMEHLRKNHPSKLEEETEESRPNQAKVQGKASFPRVLAVPKNQLLLPGLCAKMNKEPRAKVGNKLEDD